MALLSSSRSAPNFSWADDDEDDWTFEDHMERYGDVQGPTLTELGPLQHTTSSSSDLAHDYEVAPLEAPSTEECTTSLASDQPQVQDAHTTFDRDYTPSTAYRQMNACEIIERCPAYPELSHDNYGNASKFKRMHYFFNWRHKKINEVKLKIKDQFHYKKSKLCEEMRPGDDIHQEQSQDSAYVEDTAIAAVESREDSSDTDGSASTPATSPPISDDGKNDAPGNSVSQ